MVCHGKGCLVLEIHFDNGQWCLTMVQNQMANGGWWVVMMVNGA